MICFLYAISKKKVEKNSYCKAESVTQVSTSSGEHGKKFIIHA
jgi:hypothetical protein